MITTEILNVSLIEPKLKHPTIFKVFDELAPGEGFIIDNDHDPKPLYYQLLGERGNIFNWEYLVEGPERWQVRIDKRENSDGETIGTIAAKDQRKAAVFKAKGIDFSCGGHKTLEEAAREKGLEKETLQEALEEAEGIPAAPSKDYRHWEVDFLTDYIRHTHHRYIKSQWEAIGVLTEKVAEHHHLFHPEWKRLAQAIPSFLQGLLTHVHKEEKIVFPAICHVMAYKNGEAPELEIEPGFILESTRLLQKEHAIITEDLLYFRKLTDGYQVPEDACDSYRYLYSKLADLERDLQDYMHLENNILFPKAVALEKEAFAAGSSKNRENSRYEQPSQN